MTNVPKSIREKQMFMSMNHILCQKSTFSKVRTFSNGEFLKKCGIFEKHGILCQKSTFSKVRTFSNGEFLKNAEFCVKSRLFFEKNVILHV